MRGHAPYSQQEKNAFLNHIRKRFGADSQRAIARRLHIGRTTVNRWSKEIGLQHKKHTVNEKFFDTYSEESAYILGFIFADGNVTWNTQKGYYSLTITSAAKDKEHLETIRNMLTSTKPLLYSEKTNSYRLIVNSKRICATLIALGVIPRKTLKAQFPNIPKEYSEHFIRGVIDGDGNVRFVKREKSPYFEITISSGSRAFCEGIVREIKKDVDVEARIRKISGKNTHIIQYSCSRGLKLAKHIYKGAHIFLERKHLPYKKWMEEKENDKNNYIRKRDRRTS